MSMGLFAPARGVCTGQSGQSSQAMTPALV